jgi:uncharacterized protein with von Willebrand factor type A (vWA) domain
MPNQEAPLANAAFLPNLLYFIEALRRAGIPVALDQILDLSQALTLVEVGDRGQVYYTLRGLLIHRKEDLLLFEQIFNLFWRPPDQAKAGKGQKMPLAPRHDPPERKRLNIVTLMAEKARANAPEVEAADKAGSFSPTELLQNKAFSAMTPAELANVKKLIRSMQWQVSRRRTRRYTPDRGGKRLDLRRVLRSAAKHGGVPLGLTWKTRKVKPRPVVVLADISGSMEKYTRLLLQFYYSMMRGLDQVECFVFGTRLTRITPQLRLKNIDRALSEAARTVVDWAGGTRIGDSLQRFNRDWSRRVLRRGAIVLIISDGWERGDVSLLRREMGHLQRRCHRLIWLNPLLGGAGYEPLVEGMAAALPFIDDFLPVHNLQSLEALSNHLANLR